MSHSIAHTLHFFWVIALVHENETSHFHLGSCDDLKSPMCAHAKAAQSRNFLDHSTLFQAQWNAFKLRQSLALNETEFETECIIASILCQSIEVGASSGKTTDPFSIPRNLFAICKSFCGASKQVDFSYHLRRTWFCLWWQKLSQIVHLIAHCAHS